MYTLLTKLICLKYFAIVLPTPPHLIEKRQVSLVHIYFNILFCFFKYKENLLMAAIRSGQTDMAEFLIDVGINYNFKTKYFVSISNQQQKYTLYSLHDTLKPSHNIMQSPCHSMYIAHRPQTISRYIESFCHTIAHTQY